MSGTPHEPTEGSSEDAAPIGRSRYEDYDLTAPVPTPQPAPRRRTPLVAVAALVLAFSGLLPLITVVAFRPSGAGSVVLSVLGVAELVGAALVFLLHPLGRPVGIALGVLGVALGIYAATQSPANGLVTLALNGYVIYALASSGPAFRRG
jgi:hypothetical protein